MASNHHAQPLPPSGHIHHPPHQYASHPPPPQRPAYPATQHASHNGSSSSHSMANRHLPPLSSQSPPYPHRQDSALPPLSPYNQRPPYPPSTSFPPPLSRQPSQHQGPPPPPPPSYHHQQPQPSHYPPPPSSHGHGHWESQQNGRHEAPAPPQHPSHPHHPGHQRSDSSSSKLNGVPPTRRPSISERESTGAPEPPPAIAAGPREAEDAGPPASDFVKKLAKMLDDPNYSQVVSWGPKGDCFVVKDMTEFTKSILPRMFKHSNFASFVRQLNKYDFHKIKNSDEFGDQCWTFHHPDFQRSNRDALENIKRKVPAQRKAGRGGAATGPNLPGSPSDAGAGGLANVDASAVNSMQAQIDTLSRSNEELAASFAALERNYQNVLNEMVVYQRGMAAQDSLMQNLISYFIQLENGKSPTDGLGKVIETYGGERPSFPHLNGMAGMSYSGSTASDSTSTLVSSSPELTPMERSVLARQESMQRLEELKRAREARNAAVAELPPTAPTPGTAPYLTSLNPVAAAAVAQAAASASTSASATARVTPQPAPEWTYPARPEATIQEVSSESGPSNFAPAPSAGPSLAVNPMDNTELLESPGGSRLRLRKGTFAPAWVVPPRVLLVDDDQVSRKIFSKFLRVSGCTIDIAVDGLGAVNKMNLEKYDLVLMDIVMPKLDGISATSLIRQFNHMTPIIAMASNPKPNDVATYYSSGMNDILPKPFTRESLFTMLEKHLKRLKAITMARPAAEEPVKDLSKDQYSNMLNLLGMGPDGMTGFPPLDPTATVTPQPAPKWTYPTRPEATIQEVSSESGPSSFAPAPSAGPSLAVNPMGNTELLESPSGSRLRIRKRAFTPAWAVPPRVLLVDDDQVSRKLFSKFLQVSGCTVDVAVDGIGAVNKMNLEKFDLVLMDIVMPKLDGVSATFLIRQFDRMTPIIAMTSNSKPSDVVAYYSSGMNDVLPKPFTRESLFTMLEKHLMHLKATARPAAEEPSNTLSDDQYSFMLKLLGMGPDDMTGFPPLDPTAGTVMTDSAGSAKRALEGVEDDRDIKRSRFRYPKY